MKLIAVTGASGHLGVSVCRLLLKNNYKVRALQRKPYKVFSELGIEEFLGDVADKEYMEQALQGVDAVIHCAAKISIDGDKDGEVARINVAGTQCVIDTCVKLNIKNLVHISSIHAFNQGTNQQVNATSPLVEDKGFAYDCSKRDGLLRVQAAKDQLNNVILCPVGLIGPDDHRSSLMGEFFRNFYNGKLPSLVKGAFYWADTRDTATAVVNALAALDNKKVASGSVYLLGGHYASVAELARIAEQAAHKVFYEKNKKKKKMWRPELPYIMALVGLPFLRAFAYLTGGPPLYTYESLQVLRQHPPSIDSNPAQKDLGYKLRPLDNTVEDIYRWFSEQGKL